VTYYKQLHRHAPAEGLIGDCWRTCIANLLGLKPTEVPHFVGDTWDGPADKTAARNAAQAWLAKRGLMLVELCFDAYCLNTKAMLQPLPLYILTGQSYNFPDICHSVLGKGAFQVVFDPAQNSEEGNLTPYKCSEEQSIYWVELILPINLATFLQSSESSTSALRYSHSIGNAIPDQQSGNDKKPIPTSTDPATP